MTMGLYAITLPAALNPFEVLPDRLTAYFAAKGYQTTGDAQVFGDGTATLTLDRDPSADVAAFANAQSAQEQNVATAIAYLKTTYLPYVQGIPAASRTPEQRAITAILTVLKAQLTP
jgi:hypothetical protein